MKGLSLEWFHIESSLKAKVEVWQKHLETHSDIQFTLYIINGGFHIGYQEHSPRKSSTHSLLLLVEHPEVIENCIYRELGMGRLLGSLLKRDYPFNHCSPFGVIPKKGMMQGV